MSALDTWLEEPYQRAYAQQEADEARDERMCKWCEDVPAVQGERECAECIADAEAEEARAAGDSRRSDDR